ncbi:hypothetical protein DL96DRAFT_1714038 [Flagelloscypha sp. PMI_526]|nr:hypothetical protein DL96DRAFT_1714038 [Flagelloscypha sp. PMI_526]
MPKSKARRKPKTKVLVPFPPIPLDVGRTVFGLAASQDLTTAKMLSLVSKNVQTWSDVHLFRHILTSSPAPGTDPVVGMLDLMLNSDSVTRYVRARAYVTTVRWQASKLLLSNIIPNLLLLCPNLTFLQLRQAFPSEGYHLQTLRLRFLQIDLHDPEESSPKRAAGLLTSPCFQTVVYLHPLYFDSFGWDLVRCGALNNFSRLRVLCLPTSSVRKGCLLQHVVEHCQCMPAQLELLILVLGISSVQEPGLHELRLGLVDPRIIIGLPSSAQDRTENEWVLFGDLYELSPKDLEVPPTFWDKALQILRTRSGISQG